MPDSVPQIAVVGDADEVPELELVHPGLLLHLAQGGDAYVFSVLLMPFGQVPEPVPFYEQVVPAAVAHQSAGCIDLLEFGAEAVIHLVGIGRRDVDAAEFLAGLEHQHQGVHVYPFAKVEFHGVGVGEGLVPGLADYDAALFEVYPVHIKNRYLCGRLQI